MVYDPKNALNRSAFDGLFEDGVTLNADDILAHCRSRMTFEKSPKVVVFGTEIPVTTTGKYMRLKLQDLFAEWEKTQFRT